MNYFLDNALAKGTETKYLSQAHAYTTWAKLNSLWVNGYVLCPTTEDLVAYCSYLATPGTTPEGKTRKALKYGTIKGHLTGIGSYWHSMTGVDPCKDQFTGSLPPVLRSVLRGIRRTQIRSKKTAEPLTTDRLKLVIASTSRMSNRRAFKVGYDDLLLNASSSTAVYALLRLGEVISSHTKDQGKEDPTHDPTRNLTWSDVNIYFDRPANPIMDRLTNSYPKPSHATILLKDSKTDVFRDGSLRRIYATGTIDCPVTHLHRYRMARIDTFGEPHINEPFFVRSDGKWMTRDWFTTHLREAMLMAGLKASDTSSHSCRAGGACSLLAAGASEAQVKLLGRWTSSCFLQYLTLSPLVLRDLAAGMSSLTVGQMDHRELESLSAQVTHIREMAE